MAGRMREGTQEGLYQLEHWSSWLMGMLAVALVVAGLLVGFGILGAADGSLQFNDGALEPGQGTTVSGDRADNFRDGALFLLPGIAAAFLAFTLHMNDHHRYRDVRFRGEAALGTLEHMFGYLLMLGTIGLGGLGILVGFDAFDNGNAAEDGILWELAAITSGALTAAYHTVRQHAASEDDYLISIVEERVGAVRHEPVREEPRAEEVHEH